MKYFILIIKYVGIIATLCAVGYIAWALWFALNFHGDTYKDAEPYIIVLDNMKTSEVTGQRVIDLFYEFQCSYPEYRIIGINGKGEKYHNFGDIGESYPDLVFFYFKDINKSVSCIVETPVDNAVIKLYAVNDGVIFRKWRRINNYKEITRKENREITKKFEKEILDQLGVKWRHKRWWE
ncbi:MAG: hypothetical protein LBK03_01795 [Bacteroidales bacterium]|jgi:hypothetical protein|nr:hypothetical protein [Bacteroidales bacterium]